MPEAIIHWRNGSLPDVFDFTSLETGDGKCVLTNSKNGTELIIPLGSIQYIETDKGNEGTD